MESRINNPENVYEPVKQKNKLCSIGFWFGIASIFLNYFGLIPLVGIVICIVGLIKFDKSKHKNLTMGTVGLVLNILYLIVNAYNNGHLG